VVGVSNDAVNFLNSAIGSKAAPFKVIMIIASLGIIVGATFSSGMMEVARKGIFHPQYFYFNEIMVIFLAVMITDILLLDAFNTFGMPTSTTVSIVFELLGAAVGMSIIKTYTDVDALSISEYINSSKALAIISGILLSVGIAFAVGALVQYVTRLILTFKYEKNLKFFGAIWGGIAITAITYFILIKGAKGASFMSDELKEAIKVNTVQIILVSFVIWVVILQLLSWLTKFNILKLIVLVGTFALAMAFAGNDLVNFIGVPLAGFESFKLWVAAGSIDPGAMGMEGLAGKVKTPTLYLLIAGLIMVITLWTSKKARTVTETEINLARQDAGYERFGSTGFSRALVRGTRNAAAFMNKLLPPGMQRNLEKRFEPALVGDVKGEVHVDGHAHFDLVRASVNLTVASILISFATSLKLPLSTTYVTFMVAMGTSLSDRAWGRESAVYRITGVFSVIGGWFLTAIIAFTVALVVAFILYYGHIYAVIGLLLLIIFIVYRTRLVHKRVVEQTKEASEGVEEFIEDDIAAKATMTIIRNLKKIVVEYDRTIYGLEKEDLKELRKAQKNVDKMTNKTKYLKDNIGVIVDKLMEDTENTAFFFVQVMDYMREVLHSITFIVNPSYEHVNNNHKTLIEEQLTELRELKTQLSAIVNLIVQNMESGEFDSQEEVAQLKETYLEYIEKIRKQQIKRVKLGEVGTRNTMLYLNIVNEIKNLSLQVVNLYKSQRDFINYKNGKNFQ
jgi:phosphate/sulfate permease